MKDIGEIRKDTMNEGGNRGRQECRREGTVQRRDRGKRDLRKIYFEERRELTGEIWRKKM